MLKPKDLRSTLHSIDKKDYLKYQELLGAYDFSFFKLIIEHIPKDPFAPPHTGIYRIQVLRSDERIINVNTTSKEQTTAFADFLARAFFLACLKYSKKDRGTGYSGLITINQPSQIVLERTNVVITDDIIEVRCFLGLPGNKRIILSDIAEDMFFTELPNIIEASLFKENTNLGELKKHIDVVEDSEYLRNKLDSLGFIAFVANDSNLPRESGISDKPMLSNSAIPFTAPDSLSQQIKLPNAGTIRGLAIKKGVNLIVGGGYHGKSTLLNALEAGIYNHIPGDGREYCVSSDTVAKVRAYSGRRVVKTNISSFINNLPYDQDTTAFSTENASGSTSQAVNIVEAIEAGAKTLLMDEDTCATNFMIRDSKMQNLVSKKDEPISAYIDKVKQLNEEKNISTILVLGGVGDYFDVSDCVIQMKNYQAYDVTKAAQQISIDSPIKRQPEHQEYPICVTERIPLTNSINSINQYGKFSIFTKEIYHLNFGDNIIDLTDVEQLVELSQTKALGYAIEYAKKYMDKKRTLREIVEQVMFDIKTEGLDILSDKISGDFSKFRSFELIFAINRLRELEVLQK